MHTNKSLNESLRDLRLVRSFIFLRWDKSGSESDKKIYSEFLRKIDSQIAEHLSEIDREPA